CARSDDYSGSFYNEGYYGLDFW
nr:immunoglobulin heavy chain junction region [Macaca mulatta]MOV44932.1 immunoglobulin heavy chain junction region [Macaca mulatta]